MNENKRPVGATVKKINPEDKNKLLQDLQAHKLENPSDRITDFFKPKNLTISFFKSGKISIQGSPKELLEFVDEARKTYSSIELVISYSPNVQKNVGAKPVVPKPNNTKTSVKKQVGVPITTKKGMNETIKPPFANRPQPARIQPIAADSIIQISGSYKVVHRPPNRNQKKPDPKKVVTKSPNKQNNNTSNNPQQRPKTVKKN